MPFICINGKLFNLGTFQNIEDAIQTRLQAEKDLWEDEFKPRRSENVDYEEKRRKK
jgi:hypothetical protein